MLGLSSEELLQAAQQGYQTVGREGDNDTTTEEKNHHSEDLTTSKAIRYETEAKRHLDKGISKQLKLW